MFMLPKKGDPSAVVYVGWMACSVNRQRL